ncbi:unnamed protein product [Closterium sp. Yama58-4]|nr:unnamed protein product [Closterium sp. Yama58-4]
MEALAASDNTQSTDGRQSSLSLAEPELSVCLHVALPDGFSLPAAVCSYGFFMMAPTVWIPPRVSESTAQEGLGVKSEAEEAAGEPGSAEGGRREAGDGREGAEGSGTDAERKGLDEEGERGSSGNAWEEGEQAWGEMERPLRLADGRAVMVRITQHGAADVTHHGAADVTQHNAADVTQHGAADVTQHGAADVTQHGAADVTQHGAADVLELSSGDGSAGLKEEPADALCDGDAPTAISSATADAAAAAGRGLSLSCGRSLSILRSILPTPIASNLTCTPCRTSSPPAPALSPPLQAQVRRMLRLSPACQAALQAFHRRHAAAAAAGFGRLYRSPSLFEDLVKAQLLCNCGWGRSLGMARALCLLQRHHFGPPIGARDSPDCVGAFPEPQELAGLEIPYLTSRCGLGYRGPRIAKLAADVASGAIDLESLQRDCLQESPESGCGSDVAAVSAAGAMTEEPAVGGGVGGQRTGEAVGAREGATVRGAGDVGVHATRGACRRKRRRSCDGGELSAAAAVEETQAPVTRYDSSRAASEGAPCPGTVLQTHGAMRGRRQASTRRRKGCGRGKEGEVRWEEAVRQRVQRLPGFGPFSSANALQCMGVFCFVPADSETIRHLQARGHKGCTAGTVDALAARAYAAHAPFQFLAYCPWQAERTNDSWLHLWHGRWDIWGEYERVFGPMAHLPSSRYPAITGHNMRAAGGAGARGRGGEVGVSHSGGREAVEGKAGGGGGGGGGGGSGAVMGGGQRRRAARRTTHGNSSTPPSRLLGGTEGHEGADEGGAEGRRGGGESRGGAAAGGVVSTVGEAAAATDVAAADLTRSAGGGMHVQCRVARMGVRRSRRVAAQRSQRGTVSGAASCGECLAASRGGGEQQRVDGKSRARGSSKGRRRRHSGGGDGSGQECAGRVPGTSGGERTGSAAGGRARESGKSELERDEVRRSEMGEERGGKAATALVVQSGEEMGRECVRAEAVHAVEQQQRENGQGQQREEQQGGAQQVVSGEWREGSEQAWVAGEQHRGRFDAGEEVGVAGVWAIDVVQRISERGMAGAQEGGASGKGRVGEEEGLARHRPNRRLLL